VPLNEDCVKPIKGVKGSRTVKIDTGLVYGEIKPGKLLGVRAFLRLTCRSWRRC
jgi:hypothetical protein